MKTAVTPQMLIETVPLQHDVNSDSCWCNPELKQVCPELDEDVNKCKSDCYRCGGEGWVDVYDESLPIIILHRANL